MGEYKKVKRGGERPADKRASHKSSNKFKKLDKAQTDYDKAKEFLFATKPKNIVKTDEERKSDIDFEELLKIFETSDAGEGDEVVLYPTDEKKRLTTKVTQIKSAVLSGKKFFSQYYTVAYLLVYQYGFAMDMKIDVKTYMDMDFSLPELLADGSSFFVLVSEVFEEKSPDFLQDSKEVNLLQEKLEKLFMESEHYDKEFFPHLKNWSWERVSLTKKTILRLASYFIEHEKFSKKFIISESVNLAKWFGEEKDYSFINAILAKKFI